MHKTQQKMLRCCFVQNAALALWILRFAQLAVYEAAFRSIKRSKTQQNAT